MPAPSDLVHGVSSSTGTGNVTLVNVNGKRSFNTAFGTGGSNVFDYFISNRDAAEWERGTGHLSAASTLVRDTVLASSNANNAVNFAAGTKDVTNDVPAMKQMRVEAQTISSGDQDQVRDNISAFGVVRVQVFTTSGTYTPHPDMLNCIIECLGGGGGAGGGTGVNPGWMRSGGGGSGGYSRRLASAATIGASQTVTIGAGGAGGTNAPTNGSAGGATSVGSLCVANGGGGGTLANSATAPTGGVGASAGTGTIAFPGNGGEGGTLGFSSLPLIYNGQGAASHFGGAPNAIGSSGGGTFNGGPNASLYGAGGGGGVASDTGAGFPGGSGSQGIVIITEFCSK